MVRDKLPKTIREKLPHDIFTRILKFMKHYVLGLFKRIDENNLFLAAAGISYFLFLSIIPFILLVFSILGNIFEANTLIHQIDRIIDTTIPYPRYSDYVKTIISTNLPEVIEYKTIAGYIGVIGLIFTSTWIFSSLRTILNQIFHSKIQKSAFIGLSRDVGMVILMFLFITVFTIVIPAFAILIDGAGTSGLLSYFHLTSLWDTIVRLVSIIAMFGMFFLLIYLIPYERLEKRVALLSASWATLLWEIARSIFGYYVRHFLGRSAIYGAFVLIVVVMLWVFYSSCIFIISAEIGQLYRERRQIREETTSDEAV
jgi:membrane protein